MPEEALVRLPVLSHTASPSNLSWSRHNDRKQHKEDCAVGAFLAETSPALQLLDERLEIDPHLLKYLLALGVSLLNLHLCPEAYNTHYIQLEWSNRTIPGAPQPVYLEKYRVLPMTQATPDFLKDVKIARTEKGSQIMFDLMLFGSERFPDGPYSHSINIPAPRPDSIVVCSYLVRL